MGFWSLLQYALFLLVVAVLVKPVGGYLARVLDGEETFLSGEIVFGGLGGGIYSSIMIALVGLLLAVIMIGRSPEYLGKLIGTSDTKLITLYTLAGPVVLMALTAVAVVTKLGLAGLTVNEGPHGFTEIFHAYASSFTNNGQNFASLNANTPFYNVTTAIAMMVGRFGLAIPALALAGLFAMQRRRPATLGTLPTDTVSFAVLLVGTAIIVGGLSYFAALALGPVVEHFLMIA